MVLSQYQMLQI